MTKQAIILAAGTGNRLKPLTDSKPKGMVEVNGVSILANAMLRLKEVGVEEVVLVIGHKKEKILEAFGDEIHGLSIKYIISNDYSRTNNIVSLWYAREYLDRDTFLLESDIFLTADFLPLMTKSSPGNLVAVSPCTEWSDGTMVRLDDEDNIEEIVMGGHGENKLFKTINVYLFTKDFLQELFLPYLRAYIDTKTYDQYYEVVLSILTNFHRVRSQLKAVRVSEDYWTEIDDCEDLRRAEYCFASPEKRYDHVKSLHGWFGDYDFVDHSYLYNLHFPSRDIIQDFARHADLLIKEYPSGQKQLAECMARYLGVAPENVVVGNGASELIKILMRGRDLVIPTPSFNEYENAASRVFPVPLDDQNWALDPKMFISQMTRGSIGVIVTPNNPTSIVVPRGDIIKILESRSEQLIVDESFLDFCDNSKELTLVPFLDKYPHLVILKSMSKVFGIPGLRLGYIISSNVKYLDTVRREIPIWNINAFAEYFLRRLARYQKKVESSMAQVRQARDQLYLQLSSFRWLRSWKPSANYVFCHCFDAESLAKDLFVRFNVFVKSCGNKTMRNGREYIRIASRTVKENDYLVQCLRARQD